MNNIQPTLLDMNAVGAILSITPDEATALVEARQLRGFQVGDEGEYLTRPADVGQYLAEQKLRTPPTLARTIKR